MMERILVFGGLDFVGYHLCRYVLEKGIETIIGDYYDASKLQMERYDTIGRNALLERVKIAETSSIDMRNFEDVDTVYFVYKPYYFFDKQDQYSQTYKLHSQELEKAIKIASVKGAKLVFLSSFDVKGTNNIGSKNECSEQTYMNYKRELENLLQRKSQQIGGNLTIVRIPYVFGPWCEDDCFIQDNIRRKFKNERINFRISADKLIYVQNLVEVLYQIGNDENRNGVITYISENRDQLKEVYKWFGLKYETEKVDTKADSTLKINCKKKSIGNIIEGLNKTKSYVRRKVENTDQ
jgi:UDP-glucose 4-epimerase